MRWARVRGIGEPSAQQACPGVLGKSIALAGGGLTISAECGGAVGPMARLLPRDRSGPTARPKL